MDRSPRPGKRLLRWLQRGPAPTAPRQPDPADMGTCFGLEMSFDDAPVDPFARPPQRTPERAHREDGGDASAERRSSRWPWGHTAPGAI
jgi:hypothetical protein